MTRHNTERTVSSVTLAAAAMAGLMVVAGSAHALSLPSGYGISANYIGDEGIANDPKVVFVENFETGTIDASRFRSPPPDAVTSRSKQGVNS